MNILIWKRNHGSHAAGACLGQSNSTFLQNQAEKALYFLHRQILLPFLGITPLFLVICGPLKDFSFSVILRRHLLKIRLGEPASLQAHMAFCTLFLFTDDWQFQD